MKITMIVRAVVLLLGLQFATFDSVAKTPKTLHFNPHDVHFWDNLKKFPFPQKFRWQVATSDFQLAGSIGANGNHCLNSWSMNNLPQPGISTDHWRLYKQDVTLIKNAGFNSYRFSIEWSKVNPAKGVFDYTAMKHYIDLCDELIAQGIEPVPCLFHHAWPKWFDELGGFEKGENNKYFIEFAKYVFSHLIQKPAIKMWMTFNEPVGYAMEGWIRGHYPPFKKKNFKVCGKVVLNMLRSHVEVYHAAHAMRKDVMVGFPHIFNPLDSYHYFNPIVSMVCSQMNYLLHDVALNYFKTGKFNWSYTFGKVTADDGARAKGALDYIGINYYSHVTLKFSLPGSIKPQYKSSEIMRGTRALYPKGLYKSIKKCAALGIPMYITENGINTLNDEWRDEYYRHHLAVVVQALLEGYDIRGYCCWTLMDCFEWSKNALAAKEGRANRNTPPLYSNMGIYAVDFVTKERTLREGAKGLVDLMLSRSLVLI